MEFVLMLLAVVLACGIAFGIVVLVTGNDPGLARLPDGSGQLPADRPLAEGDVARATFDTGLRGYRTGQVDEALSRLAYDIGFKDELIKVLASEVTALRDGRGGEADALREVRRRALGESGAAEASESDPATTRDASTADSEAADSDRNDEAESADAEDTDPGESQERPR